MCVCVCVCVCVGVGKCEEQNSWNFSDSERIQFNDIFLQFMSYMSLH